MSKRKYSLNESVFDVVDTEEKAYWLGFLASDGYIDTNCARLGLALSYRDFLHVCKLKDFLGSDQEVEIYEDDTFRDGNLRKFASIRVNSQYLVRRIVELGIVPRKSQNLQFPTLIPENLLHHYLRGFFDGNGTICSTKRRLRENLTQQYEFRLIGNKPFIEGAQKVLVENCNLNYNKLIFDKRKPSQEYLAAIAYGGNTQCKTIYKFLYDSATVFLERKKLIWDEIPNYVKPEITHCPQGHEYSSENVKFNKKGYKMCVSCLRGRWQEHNKKSREATKSKTHCTVGHDLNVFGVQEKSGRVGCSKCRKDAGIKMAETRRARGEFN